MQTFINLLTRTKGIEKHYIDPIETQVEINEMTNRRKGETPINLPDEEVILP